MSGSQMVIHPFPKLSKMQIALALTALAAHKSHPEQEIMKVIKRTHKLRIWCTGSFTQEQLKKWTKSSIPWRCVFYYDGGNIILSLTLSNHLSLSNGCSYPLKVRLKLLHFANKACISSYFNYFWTEHLSLCSIAGGLYTASYLHFILSMLISWLHKGIRTQMHNLGARGKV